jgi:hypothetical protein
MASFWISHLRELEGDEVIQKAAAVAWILMHIVEHAHGGWEFRLHLLTDGQCREGDYSTLEESLVTLLTSV